MKTTDAAGPVLTAQDIAIRYGVEVETVYKWNHTGAGPRFFRVGRLPRYRLADCIAWENARYADGDGAA